LRWSTSVYDDRVARPIRTAPSRGVLAAMAVVAVVAVVAVILSFGNGQTPPSSSSPVAPSSTGTAGRSDEISPSPTASATPVPTDPPAGVARWTAVTPPTPGPDARSGHSWTVDPSSAVAYLFGGRGAAGLLGDVWAYDLTADRWTALQPDGDRPAPRFEHGAAWVDGLGLVVSGGQTEDAVLDDLWAFDPGANAWRAVDVVDPRPSARAAACLAVRADGRLWLYGGQGAAGTATSELWIFDPAATSWTQGEMTADPAVRSGAACWWTSDDRLVVHGGRTPGPPAAPLGDLWAFDPDDEAGRWQNAGEVTPRERGAWTATGRGGVVAGGIGANEALLADVVVIDDRSLAPSVLGPAPDGPAARSGAALADDPEGERTLMFGGRGVDGPFADVWALDLP
jgi:Galactose oxidase, central domain